jgi:hypothetical protein
MVKAKILGYVFVLCTVITASLESADALFAQGQWQPALTAYQAEVVRTPGICLRMGECAHALKEYPHALAYWYEALPGLSFLAYYNIALRIVRLEAQLGLAPAAVTPWWIMTTAAASVPPLVWQLLLLFVLLVFLLSIRSLMTARAWYKIGVLFFSMVLAGAVAWQSVAYRTRIGAIAITSTPLLSGPDERFSEVGMLSKGAALVLSQTKKIKAGPVYYKVSYSGRRGWVCEEKIIIIGKKV